MNTQSRQVHKDIKMLEARNKAETNTAIQRVLFGLERLERAVKHLLIRTKYSSLLAIATMQPV